MSGEELLNFWFLSSKTECKVMRLGPQANRAYEMLKHRITTSKLKPGDKLPPNTELAAQYGVALVTVRHALARLRAEGLLSSKQGVGTFVRSNGGQIPKAMLIVDDIDAVLLYPGTDQENAPYRIVPVTEAIANLPGLATTAEMGSVFISVNLLRNDDSSGLLEILLAALPSLPSGPGIKN
jgi:DNA-binding GntR family transcriptional regulator